MKVITIPTPIDIIDEVLSSSPLSSMRMVLTLVSTVTSAMISERFSML